MTDWLSTEPGYVNVAYDPRFWTTLPLPAMVKSGREYWLGPGLVLELTVVLPIRGCGNDR